MITVQRARELRAMIEKAAGAGLDDKDGSTAVELYPALTGGGAVLRRENRTLLKGSGLVIFLDRSPWAIRRTLRRQGRPLLTDDDAIFRLYRQRRSLYRAAAHHAVNKPTARQAAEEAVRLWREEQQ